MNTQIEKITPELAKLYLQHNHGNRAINGRQVAALVRDIQRGRFVLTHQGIAFDKDGNLIDGQHRLTAIAMAGIPVQMMVTRNLEPDVKMAVDFGMKRKYLDAITIAGEEVAPEYRSKSAIGAIRHMVRCGYNSSLALTNNEISQLMDAFRTEVHALYKCSITRRISGAPINAAALAAIINGESASDIFSFFSVFLNGDASKSGDLNAAAAFNWSKSVTEARFRRRPLTREQLYAGTQNAIWQYIHGDAQKVIRTTKNLRYPVFDQIKRVLEVNQDA